MPPSFVNSPSQPVLLALVLASLAFVVWRRQSWPYAAGRRWWTVAAILPWLIAPLLLGRTGGILRAVIAGLSLAMTMKVIQLQAGRIEADTLARAGRFLLWLLLAPSTRWVPSGPGRAQVRRQGLVRWGRLGIKAVLLATLIGADARHTWVWPLGVWAAAFEIYFIVSGLADLITGATCLAGFATEEVFERPFLARSPADFWGRRWNLFVSGFLRRHVFAPVSRRGRMHGAALLVFIVSGLGHEHFVFASLGWQGAEPGYMMAFFGLQGLVVVSAAWARGRLGTVRFAPAGIKVGAHWLWLAATAPLFIFPVRGLLEAFEAPVRLWLQLSWNALGQ